MKHNRSHSRGVSLVEAMVALAIMGFGMLAVVGIQATMRLNADVAKQRSEATRIGQEAMEGLRAFTVIDTSAGLRAWSDIGTSGPVNVSGLTTNTIYRISRSVVDYANPPSKALSVTVAWTDRADQSQQVVLRSVIAAAAPALSGTLAVRPGTAAVAPVRRPYRRHPSIPVQARDFGTSSAFVPPFRPWIAIVFNNVTGFVTGVCNFNYETSNETITPSDVESCSNTTVGQLLTGFVRFQRSTSGPDLTAADVEDPIGPALDLRIRVQLTSSGHPQSPFCFDDMTGTKAVARSLPFVTYYCVIHSNSSLKWSGISTIEALPNGVDWRIEDYIDVDSYRVCRYTSAASDDQVVPSLDHPRNYVDVTGNLTNQNFVVISSSKHCPTDVAANPQAGDVVNTNTLQHQPAPS